VWGVRTVPPMSRIALRLAPAVALAVIAVGLAGPAAHAADPLISHGRPVTASSEGGSGYVATNAVDGDSATRWASVSHVDPQWIRIDLGSVKHISRVSLEWSTSCATAYRIDVSNDGSAYNTAYSTTTGDGGTDDIAVSTSGRYVRMFGTVRCRDAGYSLVEFNVYGSAVTPTPTPTATPTPTPTPGPTVPRPDHVVVVIMENHTYSQIIGLPYIKTLAGSGASFTNSHGVTHPSEPNYLALYSGSTQGLTDDSCPHTYSKTNLGQQVLGAGRTFVGYSEDMPSDGYTGCTSGKYARKHNPWVDFTNVPSSANQRFSRFPTDFTKLPTVSFVVPNLCNDMHDCSTSTGDNWLKSHMDAYAKWAQTHKSLLVLDFDEDDRVGSSNQIPTIFVGQQVKKGQYGEKITHYSVLRTLEDMYGLSHAGNASTATSITDAWLPTT
jgi:hypothetical protein